MWHPWASVGSVWLNTNPLLSVEDTHALRKEIISVWNHRRKNLPHTYWWGHAVITLFVLEVEIFQHIYSDSMASDWLISCIISKVISFIGSKMTFVECYSLTSSFFITDFVKFHYRYSTSLLNNQLWGLTILFIKISYSVSFGIICIWGSLA